MLKNTNSNKGFTLVELLIVIVVIAILAAISIVAYNGIQDRGKSSAAKSLASQVAKKAEIYNTLHGSYPADEDAFATYEESTLDDPDVVTQTRPVDESTVEYYTCPTGAQVVWYDAISDSRQFIGMGGAGSSSCYL